MRHLCIPPRQSSLPMRPTAMIARRLLSERRRTDRASLPATNSPIAATRRRRKGAAQASSSKSSSYPAAGWEHRRPSFAQELPVLQAETANWKRSRRTSSLTSFFEQRDRTGGRRRRLAAGDDDVTRTGGVLDAAEVSVGRRRQRNQIVRGRTNWGHLPLSQWSARENPASTRDPPPTE